MDYTQGFEQFNENRDAVVPSTDLFKDKKHAVRAKASKAFVIDDDRADESIAAKRAVASDMEDKRSGVRSAFASLYNIDKFTAGLNGMQKGMSEIAGEFEYISNIDQSFVNEGKYAVDSLASKLEELFISHDFVGNNSMEINSYNMSILGKVDGTSVNKGDKSLTEAHADTSTDINKEALTNITTGATIEQHANEIGGIVKETDFTQINKESDISQNEIDRNSSVEEKVLTNINKEEGNEEQHIEAHFEGVQEKQLESINNNVNLSPSAELEMNVDEIKEVDDIEVK